MPTDFTVAIPTHNRRETVVLAARSALAQTRPPVQLLVLCDGCTDGTADALGRLGDPRLEVLELPKASGYGYGHRNRALELARGTAIVWLGDDDLLTRDHLEVIGELWDTDRHDLVLSDGVVVHPDDSWRWFGSDWSLPFNREKLETANTNPMSSVSIRVELASAIGGWDGSLPRAADWDLWRRALAAGARTGAGGEPTVLHFPARGREQAWEDRARQNAAWLDRLEDPVRFAELRFLMRRGRAEREAYLEQRATAFEQEVQALRSALDASQNELSAARERTAQSDTERAAAQVVAARHRDTLARIYAGGWWRLRSRLLPLMRLVGRGG